MASNDNCAAIPDDFPRGHTVPFPYDPPYPQQADLMDVLLTSLATCSSRTSTVDAANKCCPVYMLESPTGTGKSLSLACASMSWLRYTEQMDLASVAVEEELQTPAAVPGRDKQQQANAASADLDWLTDWVPPAEREATAMNQAVHETAARTRTALVKTLGQLRDKWQDGEGVSSRTKRINHTRTNVVATRTVDRKAKKRRIVSPNNNSTTTSATEFCLEEYHSDENGGCNNNCDSDDDESVEQTEQKLLSNPDRILTAQQVMDGAALDGSKAAATSTTKRHGTKAASAASAKSLLAVGNVQPGSGVRKIIYAARTHSQLSQFIGELRRTAWGDTIRVVHLGGRKQLCGNALVNTRLASEKAVSEACLDLQKGSSSTKKKCPLLEARDVAVPTLALHLQAQPTDIEEAAALGQGSCACAYYASRAAVAAAEVVVVPYSMLLAKKTRDAVGLSLRQSLVIVDEAHNLPEALRSLHSCRLSLPVIQAAKQQLTNYCGKYADRLAGRNLFYLGQIRRILLSLEKHLKVKPDKRSEGMMTATELLISCNLDNVNLFRILRYMERSRLSQKLLGFTNFKNTQLNNNSAAAAAAAESGKAENATTSGNDVDGLSKHVSAMSIVETFLEKLTSSGREGKIVTDWPKATVGPGASESRSSSRNLQHPTLRYVLLHPAAFFENVLEEAHALALVGGTLRPFVHVAAELLGSHGDVLADAAKADARTSSASPSNSTSFVSPRFSAFTCDHVVPPSNVLLQCIAQGPTGQALDFRFQSRSSNTVCDELGRSLIQVCHTAPCGVVIFLPSYSYEAHLVRRWKKAGLWQELQQVKKVHREPKSAQHVEAALAAYARDAVKGAVLFSVIGGKCSEGINFSNDMARCVVVVGLPYPDITDPELKEKMANLDASSTNKTITGQAYYQNLCMRAVNQSVGRAIRHAQDYAAIVLIDRRYTTDTRIWSGLPSWLKKNGNDHGRQDRKLEQRLTEMQSFYATKKW